MHAIFEGLYKVVACRLSGPLSIPRLQGTAALQGQGRFSGRDGLRAVPFFSLLLGQLNLWDGAGPSRGKQGGPLEL